jgi:hypothetical protein
LKKNTVIMQALEMESEETQSFVGTGRKKINRGESNVDFVARQFTDPGFLGKVLAVAFVILLILMAVSTNDDTGFSGDVETKPPHSAPTTPAVPVPATTTTTPAPVPKPTPAPVPDSNSSPGTSSGSTPADDDDDDDDDDNGKNDGGGNKYSNYATIVPIPDHPLPDDETRSQLEEKWGRWHFWDGDEDERPSEDYIAKGNYPNKDIPNDDFPEEAWQADAVFVNHILNDADKLITRAMEAIFTEYGHGKPLEPEQLGERMKMFHWDKIDLSATDNPPPKYAKSGNRGNGGWTTKRSFDGLVRRLLHAIMTGDSFTVVLGGHSAAVGQG